MASCHPASSITAASTTAVAVPVCRPVGDVLERLSDDGVDAVQLVVAVPEGNGVTAGKFDGAQCVSVVERPGERDDADAHVSPPRESR